MFHVCHILVHYYAISNEVHSMEKNQSNFNLIEEKMQFQIKQFFPRFLIDFRNKKFMKLCGAVKMKSH